MSDLPPLYACEMCGKAVNPLADGTWRKVTGWVEQRKGGGTHSVFKPSPPHAYACRECMFDLKLGINSEQQTLL